MTGLQSKLKATAKRTAAPKKASAPAPAPVKAKGNGKIVAAKPAVKARPSVAKAGVVGDRIADDPLDLFDKVRERESLQEQKKALEERISAINVDLEMALEMNDLKETLAGNWKVQMVEQRRGTLKKEKLLEAGVSVEVMERCTEYTESHHVRVYPLKNQKLA